MSLYAGHTGILHAYYRESHAVDRKPGLDKSYPGDGSPRSRISLPAHRCWTEGHDPTRKRPSDTNSLKVWYAEGHIPALVKFDMPKLETKRLPVLTAEQLRQIVKVCNVREKPIVLFVA
jgi:hypothetical protein